MRSADLAVIGAGPAGMAAAAKAAELGLKVILLDEQPRAGGQIYRDVDRVTASREKILGKHYTHGRTLTAALKHERIDHVPSAIVWAIDEGFCLSCTHNGRAWQVTTGRVLLATGALERPMVLPGWTLPGVMTAGAGQILLKQSGVLARHAVLVGCGPLLYLIAAQMVRAGTPPLALVETQTWRNLIHATRHFDGTMRGWPYLATGAKLLAEIIAARVPRFTGATDIAIDGRGKAESLTFRSGGQARRLECSTVYLHHGVVPNTQAARSVGVTHHWNAAQQCFVPRVDTWGHSDVPGIFIAGDASGIGGARVAELAGQLAAVKIAEELGHLSMVDRDRVAAPLQATRLQELAIRPFLDAAYPPFSEALNPADSTVVCRCEEVTAGNIREYVKLGCLGPNQTKAFGRAGMGPCQGRFCGLTVTALLAESCQQSPDATGYYRIRPPLKPVTLGELASLAERVPETRETGGTDT